MRLRNKKTGAIGELRDIDLADGAIVQVETGHGECCGMIYATLAELNEEWEDYEEPKEDYIRVIESFIHYAEEADDSFYCDKSVKKFVEKLKAWKRLKDKGFMFCGTDCIDTDNVIYFEFGEGPLNQVEADESEKDLDLLFGGKE